MSPSSIHSDSPSPDTSYQLLYDPSSDLQGDAAAALAARHPGSVLLGAAFDELAPSGEIICLDADLFSEILAPHRARAWFAPLAWHRDAVALPHGEMPRRVMLLHDSLAELFPRAQIRLMAYPMAGSGTRRGDRESARQRLGLSPGRMAVFCREESSPLMRVMKALENDERITVLTTEDDDQNTHGPATSESMLLGACDLFVAESSALAVAESLTHGIPLAAIIRDGGDANARLLAEAGGGVAAARPGEMLLLIDMLAASYPSDTQRMRRTIDAIRSGALVTQPAKRMATHMAG